MTSRSTQPRVAALVGPYGSGKTTLLESFLAICGAVPRKGSVDHGTSAGDASPEARRSKMGVELNIAGCSYLGDRWTFLDCPGSIEFQQDTQNALMVCDVAVVVVEPEPQRAIMVAPLLRFLDQYEIPHILFINKVEAAKARLAETLTAIQELSERKLLLRESPISGDSGITGFIDLVSQRAYKYRNGQQSERIATPDSAKPNSTLARQELLENLADLDDHLLEELLSDIIPDDSEVYRLLAQDLGSDLVVPVFFGSAAQDYGIRRLLKSLRHDVDGVETTRLRVGVEDKGDALARVFKTQHAAHTGKLSFARVWRGGFAEGTPIDGHRPSGLYIANGAAMGKCEGAGPGDIVGFGRLEPVRTGDMLGGSGSEGGWPVALPPLFSLAVTSERKQDDVKLTAALAKLNEEDPSLKVEHNADTGELVLWGQGEIHLQIALERLRGRFNLEVSGKKQQVPYKETIRKPISEHGRHKRQSGGHGQFGDVYLDIAPLPRGSGFKFGDKVVGGVVPRQYIPAVEEGVGDYLKRGPLGFPVVDVGVVLTSGSYHTVDSSDMAFKQAARIAMTEGMPKCDPVLLEPILAVEIAVPAEFTSKAQLIISSRRGRILGNDVKEGWKGWDKVSAHLPQAEMSNLIVDLRSLTMGVGTFSWAFDHYQEMQGRAADKVIEQHRATMAAQ
jgi:elongation factor G